MTLVYVNTSLADVKKLNYLMSMLTQEAKVSVSGSFFSNENYQIDEKLLKERYGDKQTVVTSHYTEMIKKNSKQLKGLFNLYNQVETFLTSVKCIISVTNVIDAV